MHRKKMLRRAVWLLFPLLCSMFLAPLAAQESEEFLALELGATKEQFKDDEDEGQIVALVSYTRKNGRFYGEVIGGSLNGDRHANVIFGGIGYWHAWGNFYGRLMFGVGYSTHTNAHLSSHNMFTEAISLGHDNFYLSYRHMSNGGTHIGNPDPNRGEDSYLLGYMHEW